MNLNKNRHSVFKLQYHLILVTKYRHKCINTPILERLKTIAKELFQEKWSCTIVEIEGENDHLHILFETQPQIQLSKLINSFKSVSSRYIQKEYKEHLNKYYWKSYFWSMSYCLLSSGGAPIEVIKEYIRSQEKPKNTD